MEGIIGRGLDSRVENCMIIFLTIYVKLLKKRKLTIRFLCRKLVIFLEKVFAFVEFFVSLQSQNRGLKCVEH